MAARSTPRLAMATARPLPMPPRHSPPPPPPNVPWRRNHGASPADRDRAAWLDRLDREQDNLDAALTWLVDQPDLELAIELVVALWPWWCHLGERTMTGAWRARIVNRIAESGCVPNRLATLNGSLATEASPIGTTTRPERLQRPHR